MSPPAVAKAVLVVDDHPIARAGIRRVLEAASRRFEIAEAEDGDGALRTVRALKPALVILDLHLPTARGTSVLCREIVAASPGSRILICTAFADTDEICACLEEGARGCVLKDSDTSEVLTALMRVEAGETAIEPRVAERVAARLTRAWRPDGGPRLTSRERSVLQLLGDGLSNRRIANRLILSEHTVKGHVTSVLQKLGASSRLEAVAVAMRDGVLAPSTRHGAVAGATRSPVGASGAGPNGSGA